MHRAVLSDCLPWMAALAIAVACAGVLLRLSGAQLRLARLRSIHRCQAGGVQSLSFVLTLPAFIMVLMLIVQVSQIMIGTILVHYAAYASARSAIVWVPANVGGMETENRVSSFAPVPGRTPAGFGATYRVDPAGAKYGKIKQAAVLACLPLAPSRDLGYSLTVADGDTAAALATVYQGLDGESGNPRIAVRLANKLAYSSANTEVQVEFTHYRDPPGLERDPPLGIRYNVPDYRDEFQPNEMGWRDQISVQVTHHLALLPGPGRLLARAAGPRDSIHGQVDRRGKVYVWPLRATATLGNEGEKPLKSYVQEEWR